MDGGGFDDNDIPVDGDSGRRFEARRLQWTRPMDLTATFSRLRHATLIVVRLSLILSLWQAPIPWVHCHGTDISIIQSVDAASELSNHLAAFHGNATHEFVPLDFDLGWHFHWILPCWGHALDQTPQDQPPSEECMTFDQVTVSANPSSLDLAAGMESFLDRVELVHVVVRPNTHAESAFSIHFSGRDAQFILRC